MTEIAELTGSVGQLIATQSRLRGKQSFLESGSDDRVLSYAALARTTSYWRDRLGRGGSVQGDGVLLLISDPLAFVPAFLGVIAAGRCAVPVDPAAPIADLLRTIAAAGPGLVVTDQPDRAAGLPIPFEPVPVEVPVDPAPGSLAPGSLGPGSLRLSTSGSTGAPKVVQLQEQQLLHVARSVARSHELAPEDRGYCSLPLFHINAEVVAVLATLVAGGTLVLDQRLHRDDFWGRLARLRVSWLNAVPAIYAILAREPVPAAHSELRFVRSASSPLPAQLRARIEESLGVPVVESYGMTEAASQITAGPVDGSAPAGSVGRPVGVELVVRTPSGAAAALGEIGRVWIRGVGVITSYVGGRAADRFDADGWLDTGDLGHVDADGFLFLAGRSDDVINRGGELIYPREVQEVLLGDPRVHEAVVVGRPDPILGSVAVAMVVPVDPSDTDDLLGGLQERCRQQLSRFKRPVTIELAGDLPRTATGKVRSAVVQRELAESVQGCR
jgi:acyl-CoA synthetase (AMP-forming)/AMP-acid ligase II